MSFGKNGWPNGLLVVPLTTEKAKSGAHLSWVGDPCELSSSLLISPELRGFFFGHSCFSFLSKINTFRTTGLPLIPVSLH